MKLLLTAIFFLTLSTIAYLPVLRSHYRYETTYDAFYYYARIKEVENGHFQIGNPYYYEHRNDLGVAFFIPDWLSAIPGAFFFWPGVSALLIFLILKNLNLRGRSLYLGTTFSFFSVLYFLVRPTSLQTIMPFFLLFFLALIKYLHSPKNLKFFLLATSLTFYIYPYLWELAGICLILLFFFKKGSRWFFLIPLLALPPLLYFYLQIHSPFYFETMQRIGLVYTHIPTVDTFKIFLIMSIPAFFLRKNLPFLLLYLSFSLLLFSPVFTGKELEIESHLERFIVLFGSLGIMTLVAKNKIFLLLAFWWAILFSKNYQPIISEIIDPPVTPEIVIPQAAQAVTVIKSKGPLNYFLPIRTKNYVLFHPQGQLHLMSSDEVLERYLVWRYPDPLTLQDLKDDFKSYSGAGPAVHVISHYNYHVRLCRLLHLPNCGQIKDVSSYYGDSYFQNILNRYNSDIIPNIQSYYQKYHVDLTL